MNYEKKAKNYYANIRYDLIQFFENKKHSKVLEIGAAYGETLFYLKEKALADEIVGIDLFKDEKNRKNYKKIDRFIFGDINEINLTEYKNYFNLILLPDVLEHIYDPKKTLNIVYDLLKDDGEIIVSMPNIRHYSAFIKIFLKGDFSYEENGIFDYTHVRFYCKKNIQDLLESSNFQIIKKEGSIRNFKGKSFAKIINMISFGLFEEFLSTQYFFKIKKLK